MAQTFTSTNAGSGASVFAAHLVNLNTLRSSFSGSTSPTSPVEGQLHDDTAGAASGDDQLLVYIDADGGGNAWVEIGAFLHTDCEAVAPASTGYQLINWRFENRGADRTAATNLVGSFWINTGSSRAKIVKDATTLDTIMHGSNADLYPINLPLDSWTAGGTPPTSATIGTTPAVPARLFDATGEKMTCNVKVPTGYSADADLKLRTWWALNVAQTANDDLDLSLNWVSVTANNNEALNKTSTNATVSTDIGNNTTQYAMFTSDLTIDYDDATNPVAAGDFLALEIHLNNTNQIAAANFLGAQLLVPFGGHLWEA